MEGVEVPLRRAEDIAGCSERGCCCYCYCYVVLVFSGIVDCFIVKILQSTVIILIVLCSVPCTPYLTV